MGFAGRIQAVERVVGNSPHHRLSGSDPVQGRGLRERGAAPLSHRAGPLSKPRWNKPKARLQGSKASKKLAMVELDRANQLLATTYGTPQKRDQAVAADENAAAAILTSEANLETAKINLWLYRHQVADCRPDQPDEHHEGQRRLSQQRRPDNRSQSEITMYVLFPGQPARVP